MAEGIRGVLRREQAAVMGILNVTPDSFSDGGEFNSVDSARKQARQMLKEGADIIDIGGESTRPGAQEVSLQQELDRVMPVIEALTSDFDLPISIDTYKPQVMTEAVAAGATMINDINGLRAEFALSSAAKLNVPICLMHMLGSPKTMQQQPEYQNVVEEVGSFLASRVAECVEAGIAKTDLFVDPGIGFGKTLNHNLSLLNAVSDLKHHSGCEVLIGVSRKSLIQKLLGRASGDRMPASIGLAVQAVINGAKIVRVHDVKPTVDAIRVVEAVDKSHV